MSDCACVYVDEGDYEAPVVFSSDNRVARKGHTCCECGRAISPGELYECAFCVWDKPQTVKTCADCLSIRNAFFCDGCQCGYIWKYLLDHIRECGGEIKSDVLMTLTKTARDRVCDMIEDTWKLYEDED